MTAATLARDFCNRFGLRHPILLAPMAGACPVPLSAAVAEAGGMGACGALLLTPPAILDWAKEFRASSKGPFQMNLWLPDPPPVRDAAHEARVREFLGRFGPAVAAEAGDARPPDFAAQCEALLAAQPTMVSSIMGVYAPDYVRKLKAAGIAWMANATTVAEARVAEAAGADVIVAQGMEAGGHRGAFDSRDAEIAQVGLFALLPAIVDAVKLPVVATGGIADARGVAAAFALGASAVQVGTGFLRTPEAALPTAWADGLGKAAPEDTMLTRGFSGRAGRALANRYARAVAASDAPRPAPYPVQRGLSAAMRQEAMKDNDLERMQAWAGQSARLAPALPAREVFERLLAGVPT
ncbi:MAG TPA: nitronate monooxygenase [Burkholderiales bacterium]|nr:nitronate monooxygenase [Burkholderiales bacterium]